jgi:hypothetical protein
MMADDLKEETARALKQNKINSKASYFVCDILSDGVVEEEEEIEFLLCIIENCTFQIRQTREVA